MKKHKAIIVGLLASVLSVPIVANAQTWVTPEEVLALNTTVREGTVHVSNTLKEVFFDRQPVSNLQLFTSTRTSNTVEWGTPAAVTELNDRSDASAYLSSDGLTIWWQRFPDGGSRWRIYTATRDDTDPDTVWENLAEVDELTISTKDNSSPVVSHDGLTMWFGSNREGGSGGYDIWVATRANKTSDWGTPVNETDLNSSDDDHPGWISLNELVFYMSSEREGSVDIFKSARASTSSDWSTPAAVEELNTDDDDKVPSLSPSRLLIWFGSDRPDGTGGDDIWASVIDQICEGDANRDGTVDPLDTGYVTSRFDCSPANDFTINAPCYFADVNGDGFVNPLDTGYILSRYGICP